MSASPEPVFRSLGGTEKHVARAWIAATVSASLTLIYGTLGAVGVLDAPGYDAWLLIDAAVLIALAYGVWRRSRLCMLLLLIYGIANEVYLVFDETARFSLLRMIFIYFYLRGTVQLFREHAMRHAPQHVNT